MTGVPVEKNLCSNSISMLGIPRLQDFGDKIISNIDTEKYAYYTNRMLKKKYQQSKYLHKSLELCEGNFSHVEPCKGSP